MQDGSTPTDTFGTLLRHYRQRAGLSQVDLAERAGVTVSAISALERGARQRPYPHTTRQLADALDLDDTERAELLAAVPRTPAQATRPVAVAAGVSAPTAPPVLPTPLIGRSLDLAGLRARIGRPAANRLITLTGLSGIGKTRVALQLAAELAATYPDGVWFVDLVPVSEPSQVTPTVATALGIRDIPETVLVERLVAFLGPREALIVLDNCEHLRDASVVLLRQLLGHCPRLQLVATSREPFYLPGEQVWRIGPLAVPERNGPHDAGLLAEVAAVQLFVERAQAVAPRFQLTDANAESVADICICLEGIPLAIELAAAWVRVLTVTQIAERLADTPAVLVSGRRSTPSRQPTLRAALDWSYALLNEPERRLFGRLSVFRGSCDLDMIERICTGGDLSSLEMLGLLVQLVDKSLVHVEHGGPVARYRLLEPVRLYASEQLAAAGEAEAVAARHATSYLALVERATPALSGPDQVQWLERIDHEHENLRKAMRWFIGESDVTSGLAMAVGLGPFWAARSYLSEGREWFAMVLKHPGDVPPQLRLAGLLWAAELAQWQALVPEALGLLDECQALAERLGDQRAISAALGWRGVTIRREGRTREAIATIEAGLEIARDLGDAPLTARALLSLGVTHRVYNEGHPRDPAFPSGAAFLEESLDLYLDLGDTRYIAIASTMCGAAAQDAGDVRHAIELFRDGLVGHQAVGDRAFAIINLRLIAALVADTQPEHAAQLLGAAWTQREILGSIGDTPSQTTDSETMARVRARLPEDRVSDELSRGQALTLEQTRSVALTALDVLAATRGEQT